MLRITSSKESILIIEPETSSRTRLILAARAEKVVSHILTAESLPKALKLLRDNEGGDIIFISHKFNHNQVLEFVAAAKNTKAGRDSAFIALLGDSRRTNFSVAQQLLHGMDGFIAEPFTIEMVQETIALAVDIKRRKLKTRVVAAARLVLQDFISKLDYVAYDAQYRGGNLSIPADIKYACSMFDSFGEQERQVYYQVMLAMFENCPVPVNFIHTEAATEEKVSMPGDPEAMLAHPDSSRRLQGIEQVIRMGQNGSLFIAQLKKLLNDPSPSCRRKSRLALSKLSDGRAHSTEDMSAPPSSN